MKKNGTMYHFRSPPGASKAAPHADRPTCARQHSVARKAPHLPPIDKPLSRRTTAAPPEKHKPSKPSIPAVGAGLDQELWQPLPSIGTVLGLPPQRRAKRRPRRQGGRLPMVTWKRLPSFEGLLRIRIAETRIPAKSHSKESAPVSSQSQPERQSLWQQHRQLLPNITPAPTITGSRTTVSHNHHAETRSPVRPVPVRKSKGLLGKVDVSTHQVYEKTYMYSHARPALGSDRLGQLPPLPGKEGYSLAGNQPQGTQGGAAKVLTSKYANSPDDLTIAYILCQQKFEEDTEDPVSETSAESSCTVSSESPLDSDSDTCQQKFEEDTEDPVSETSAESSCTVSSESPLDSDSDTCQQKFEEDTEDPVSETSAESSCTVSSESPLDSDSDTCQEKFDEDTENSLSETSTETSCTVSSESPLDSDSDTCQEKFDEDTENPLSETSTEISCTVSSESPLDMNSESSPVEDCCAEEELQVVAIPGSSALQGSDGDGSDGDGSDGDGDDEEEDEECDDEEGMAFQYLSSDSVPETDAEVPSVETTDATSSDVQDASSDSATTGCPVDGHTMRVGDEDSAGSGEDSAVDGSEESIPPYRDPMHGADFEFNSRVSKMKDFQRISPQARKQPWL